MKIRSWLYGIALVGSVAALPGCTRHGGEAAWGAPYSDITKTSSEPGAYAAASPYALIQEKREGNRLVVDVNATRYDDINRVGRLVVEQKKGNAASVTVHVYAPDEKPPKAPWRTVEWTAAGGFSAN